MKKRVMKKRGIRSLKNYLLDIQKYASNAITRIGNMTCTEFVAEENWIKQDAALCNLTTVVEAARQLTEHYPNYARANKDQFDKIKEIEKIVCIYHQDIELKAVWKLVNTLVPELAKK